MAWVTPARPSVRLSRTRPATESRRAFSGGKHAETVGHIPPPPADMPLKSGPVSQGVTVQTRSSPQKDTPLRALRATCLPATVPVFFKLPEMQRRLVLTLAVAAVFLTSVAGRPSNQATWNRCRPNTTATTVEGRALCPFTLKPVTLFNNVQVPEATLYDSCQVDALCGPDVEQRRCTPFKSRLVRNGFASEEITVAYVCARQTPSAPANTWS